MRVTPRRRRKGMPPASRMHWLAASLVLALLVFGNYSHAHAAISLYSEPAKHNRLSDEKASNAALTGKPVEFLRHKSSPGLRVVLDPPQESIPMEYSCGESSASACAVPDVPLAPLASRPLIRQHSRAPPAL